jgi:hypothetical protein
MRTCKSLYVANLYQDTVTVYAPGEMTPHLTITQGLDYPNSITLGPHKPQFWRAVLSLAMRQSKPRLVSRLVEAPKHDCIEPGFAR